MKKHWSKKLLLILILVASLESTAATIPLSEESVTEVPQIQTPLDFGLDIHYGLVYYRQYQYSPTHTTNDAGHSVHLAFEWLPIQSIGKVGVGVGFSGVFGLSNVDLGNGQFVSLRLYPLETFVSYRFDFKPRQWVVPYAKFGADFIWVEQTSKTGGPTTATRNYLGRSFTLGLEVCLSNIDPYASKELERTVGINNTFLTIEYVNSAPWSANSAANLAHDAYRLGLRFEL